MFTIFALLNGPATPTFAQEPAAAGTSMSRLRSSSNGTFRGTNVVWLGDRITPFDLQIRNGILVARYAEGGHGEPMVTTPTIQRAKFLILKDAQLESIAPLEEGEQVVEGWVTTGHEVRSFRPCLQGVLNNKDFQGQICPG